MPVGVALGPAAAGAIAPRTERPWLRESDVLPWPRWEAMTEVEPGWWRLPAEYPRLALFYALLATEP